MKSIIIALQLNVLIENPLAAAGGDADKDRAHIYHVEPRCGSLPCPPYVQKREMTCVVCTR